MYPSFTVRAVRGIIPMEVLRVSQQEDLYTRLLSDLQQINLPTDEVDIHLRPFSKTYYGRYFPVHNDKEQKPKIYLYPYEDTEGNLMSYDQIFTTAVHEFCHHIQYSNNCFIRNKGVMHDPQFWLLHNHYLDRAVKFNLIGGVESEEGLREHCL